MGDQPTVSSQRLLYQAIEQSFRSPAASHLELEARMFGTIATRAWYLDLLPGDAIVVDRGEYSYLMRTCVRYFEASVEVKPVAAFALIGFSPENGKLASFTHKPEQSPHEVTISGPVMGILCWWQ